jgi:hypothetical protein
MRGVIYNALIVEKLEIARSIGILTAYLVFPTDREGIVKVWPSAIASEAEVEHSASIETIRDGSRCAAPTDIPESTPVLAAS